MGSRNIELIGIDGNFKVVNKIAFYAEQDRDGKVFFKAESQNSSDISAMTIIYDKEEAFTELCSLLINVLTLQSKQLSASEE